MVRAGTIEEQVIALQQQTLELFRAVVDGDWVASAARSAEGIRELLA